jgi:sugar/nucleoside kinase (ribokinase family)
MKILVAGELNVDLVLQNYASFPALGREVLVEDVSLTLGSSSAICASALAKLGNDVSFIGKTGCDNWGDLCLKWLSEAGIDCSHVIRDSTLKTGITVSITSLNDRALMTYLGSIAELRADDIPDSLLSGYGHLHVSSFFLQRALRPDLEALLARARANGLTTSLDPGFDPMETWGKDLIKVLNEVNVFLPNEIELEGITGQKNRAEALRSLDNGRTLIVAKLGGEGCISIQNGTTMTVAAFPVTPVDTTGAGDSFNGGFLHAWFRGEKLLDAMRFAAACGALSTLGSGGITSQPTAIQAQEFIAARERQAASAIGTGVVA